MHSEINELERSFSTYSSRSRTYTIITIITLACYSSRVVVVVSQYNILMYHTTQCVRRINEGWIVIHLLIDDSIQNNINLIYIQLSSCLCNYHRNWWTHELACIRANWPLNTLNTIEILLEFKCVSINLAMTWLNIQFKKIETIVYGLKNRCSIQV